CVGVAVRARGGDRGNLVSAHPRFCDAWPRVALGRYAPRAAGIDSRARASGVRARAAAMKSSSAIVIGAVLITSLGCATARGPRHVDDVAYAGVPPESDWSRVAQVVPGGELVVTLKRSQPATRYFVAADAA